MPPFLLVAVAALVGCDTASSLECEHPVQNDQGEDYRCITSEDCPRPSHVLLCITDTGTNGLPECIRCRDARCVSVTPEAC